MTVTPPPPVRRRLYAPMLQRFLEGELRKSFFYLRFPLRSWIAGNERDLLHRGRMGDGAPERENITQDTPVSVSGGGNVIGYAGTFSATATNVAAPAAGEIAPA
jgi:hypothetical protein